MRLLRIVLCMLVLALPTAAQGAPDAINDALAALNQQLGLNLTLNDLFWTWSQETFTDDQLGCAPDGVTAAPASVVGYVFEFTWQNEVYEYHTSADRTLTVFCGVTGDSGTQIELVDAVGVDDPRELSNRLCPAPPAERSYIRSRLAPDIEGWVAPGESVNLRDAASTSGTILNQLPERAAFVVTPNLPVCDAEGNVWWQVIYDGVSGFVVEGVDGTYVVEPLPPVTGLAATRTPITPENLPSLAESVRLQGNIRPLAAWGQSGKLAVLGDTGAEGVWIYDTTDLTLPPRQYKTNRTFTRVVFSIADGQADVLALGSDDGSLHVWDLSPSSRLIERLVLNGHNAPISALALGPNGSRIASSGGTAFATSVDDANLNAILIWDINTVAQLFALRGHTDTVTAIAFSPDGSTLASASLDQSVRLWDMATGQQTARIDSESGATSLAFSPDGAVLVVGYNDGATLALSLVGGLSAGPLLPTHDAPVTAVAFTPDGELVLSMGVDGVLATRTVSDLLAGEDATTLTLPPESGDPLVVSPDGTTVVFPLRDRTLRLFTVSE